MGGPYQPEDRARREAPGLKPQLGYAELAWASALPSSTSVCSKQHLDETTLQQQPRRDNPKATTVAASLFSEQRPSISLKMQTKVPQFRPPVTRDWPAKPATHPPSYLTLQFG
jgi:hypothetical protein